LKKEELWEEAGNSVFEYEGKEEGIAKTGDK